VIRRVRADEWRALRDLRLRALAGEPRAFSTTLAEASARGEEQWRELATRGASSHRWATFVADEGGELIGMATGAVDDADPSVADLMQMWVDPRARRKGVGRALVGAVVAWADGRCDRLRLHVVLGEDPALALYRSLGFRDTGHRERVRADRDDVEMEMERTVRE
jgi:ribosomal protein S18 acetylase RimI-like enzyme